MEDVLVGGGGDVSVGVCGLPIVYLYFTWILAIVNFDITYSLPAHPHPYYPLLTCPIPLSLCRW